MARQSAAAQLARWEEWLRRGNKPTADQQRTIDSLREKVEFEGGGNAPLYAGLPTAGSDPDGASLNRVNDYRINDWVFSGPPVGVGGISWDADRPDDLRNNYHLKIKGAAEFTNTGFKVDGNGYPYLNIDESYPIRLESRDLLLYQYWPLNGTIDGTGVDTGLGFTVELWCTPGNLSQGGPARIFDIVSPNGDGTTVRNFMIGQQGDDLRVRCRTQGTTLGGFPDTTYSNVLDTNKIQHVVVTVSNEGVKTVYVSNHNEEFDSSPVVDTDAAITGDALDSAWDITYPLTIADTIDTEDPGTDRHWLGKLYRITTYTRALTAQEVEQNFHAGPIGNETPPGPELTWDVTNATGRVGSTFLPITVDPATNTITVDYDGVGFYEVQFDLLTGASPGSEAIFANVAITEANPSNFSDPTHIGATFNTPGGAFGGNQLPAQDYNITVNRRIEVNLLPECLVNPTTLAQQDNTYWVTLAPPDSDEYSIENPVVQINVNNSNIVPTVSWNAPSGVLTSHPVQYNPLLVLDRAYAQDITVGVDVSADGTWDTMTMGFGDGFHYSAIPVTFNANGVTTTNTQVSAMIPAGSTEIPFPIDISGPPDGGAEIYLDISGASGANISTEGWPANPAHIKDIHQVCCVDTPDSVYDGAIPMPTTANTGYNNTIHNATYGSQTITAIRDIIGTTSDSIDIEDSWMEAHATDEGGGVYVFDNFSSLGALHDIEWENISDNRTYIFRNGLIKGMGDLYQLRSDGDNTGCPNSVVRFEHCTFTSPTTGSNSFVNHNPASMDGGRLQFSHCNFTDSPSDLIKLHKAADVTRCYFSLMGRNVGSHADACQVQSDSGTKGNVTFTYNNFDTPVPESDNGPGPPYASNATLLAQAQFVGSFIDKLVFNYNWVNGGNSTVDLSSKDGGDLIDVEYIGNRFGRDFRFGVQGWGEHHPTGTFVARDNVWDDTGELIVPPSLGGSEESNRNWAWAAGNTTYQTINTSNPNPTQDAVLGATPTPGPNSTGPYGKDALDAPIGNNLIYASLYGSTRPLLEATGSITLKDSTIGSLPLASDGSRLYENKDITGKITIDFANLTESITIRNVRITGSDTNDGNAFYAVGDNVAGVKIKLEHFEATNCSDPIYVLLEMDQEKVEVCYGEIHETGRDAVKAHRGLYLHHCWMHHLGLVVGAHADGAQCNLSPAAGEQGDLDIQYNFFDMPVPESPPGPGGTYSSNACIIAQAGGLRHMRNVVFSNNWCNGGNYTMYFTGYENGGNIGTLENIVAENNWFGREFRDGIITYDTIAGTRRFRENRWMDSGQLVTAGDLNWEGNPISSGANPDQ